MSPTLPAFNYAPCTVRHLRHSLPSTQCEQCGQIARRVWEVSRIAIDVDLDQPVLLLVTVSVHRCPGCSRYFRIQPPFLRPNAIYTERVRKKAVLSVYEDGMAIRRVRSRLARDFWVSPSEAMIRRWCRDYAEGLDFEGDYQRWVVEEFSGVLCVDELYQDKLALLLAVDSAGEGGDRLVGYELIHGRVERKDLEKFLSRLRAAGIDPDEVVTDGSPIYPKALKEVWPTAVHQLCLFHESRLVTAEIYKALMALRKSVPKPPPVTQRVSLRGLPRKYPLPEKLAAHRAAIARVYALDEQGISIRGIRRRTGHSRNTIKRWLKGEIPRSIAEAELPTEWTLLEEILAAEKESEEHGSSPTPPASTPPEAPIVVPEAPPPSPWRDWEEVRHVRSLLWKCRYLILRRPDHLSDEDQDELDHLFESAVGEHIRLARSFLEKWYLIFYDEQRNRRTLQEAKERYETLMRDPRYQKLEPLARLQARFGEAQFRSISAFLGSEEWEATNNGAERTARAFRHLQAPHYNFRKPESIERALRARASLCKDNSPTGGPPPGRCARGRKAKRTSEMPQAAA
jgi:transposase